MPGVRFIQRIADSVGLREQVDAIQFGASLSVTYHQTDALVGGSDAPGSVTGFLTIDVAAGGSVSSYIKSTGSTGTEGVGVGRWDLNGSAAYAPLPGSLTVGNADGSAAVFKIDNANGLFSVGMNATLTGTSTLDGDAEVTGALSVDTGLAVSGGVIVGGGLTMSGAGSVLTVAASLTPGGAPGVGQAYLWFDSGSSLWKFWNHGGSATAFAAATDLAGYVPTSRTVSTTAPLTGGGALSGNLTLAISAASGSAAGTMSSSDFSKLAGYPSAPSGLTIAESQVTNLVTDLAGKVPTTRNVATTSPLSGGGALSGDLTLSLGTVTTANGGNGLISWTAGDIGYYASGTALSQLAIGAANKVMVSTGSAPSWTDSPTGLASLSTTSLTVGGTQINGLIPYRMAKGTTDGTPSAATTGSVGQGIFYSAQAKIVEIVFKNESVAITADATNYATINVQLLDTTGAVVATYAVSTKPSGSLATGNIAAFAVFKFSTITGITLPTSYASSNYTLTWSVAKSGAGVTTGPFELFVISVI